MLELLQNNKGLERRLAVKGYIFDETNVNFYPNDEYSTFFIRSAQQHFNDLLRTQGFIFLNDVLKYLGLKPTMVGQIAGWTLPELRPQARGYIEIKIAQRQIKDGKLKEYFLEIEHEGVILFDVLGD